MLAKEFNLQDHMQNNVYRKLKTVQYKIFLLTYPPPTVHSLGCKMAISKNPKGTGDHTYGLLCISNNDNV